MQILLVHRQEPQEEEDGKNDEEKVAAVDQ